MPDSDVTKFSDLLQFFIAMGTREKHFNAAADDPIPVTYAVNELAKSLHPECQRLLVSRVEDHERAKSFTLVPDEKNGTKRLAYFRPGQYLSFTLDIGGAKVCKPYSICSGPKQAVEGSYVVTVKATPNGFASDYILKNWKEGMEVSASAPEGRFYYDSIRDAKTIVGLAGGSGITPFHSIACAIADGVLDCNLVLLFGSRERKKILLKDAFEELCNRSDKIKVVHILSDEEAEGYEKGFMTAELIKKYAPKETYSIFVCGPQAMYAFVDKEIAKLGIIRKFVRHEVFGEYKYPEKEPDYPKECVGKTYKVNVIVRGKSSVIDCPANWSLLSAMEKNGIAAPSQCRSGECGFCRSRLARGSVYAPKSLDGRREADLKFGYIHPCCAFPTSDVTIDVPVRCHSTK